MTAQPTTGHACDNCDGIDPTTCINNPNAPEPPLPDVEVRISVDTTAFGQRVQHAVVFNAITAGLAQTGRFVALNEREAIARRVVTALGDLAPSDQQVRAWLDRNPAWLRRFIQEQDKIRGPQWRNHQ